jgi:hypothetical protein
MKRIVALALVIAALLGLGGCRKATLEDFRLYRSTPLGFSVEYPDFWQKTAEVSEGIVAFVTPKEGYSDQYTDNVTIRSFKPDMEYNAYVTGYVAELAKTVENYKLVSEKEMELGGEKAYQIVYESADGEGKNELRFMQIFALHNEKMYVVTYIGEFSSYTYFLTAVEKMLSTFTFLK